MFNNQIEDEANFCEAYKSEILGNSGVQERPSNTFSKILTILLLLIIIVAVSFYGYNYISTNNLDSTLPTSEQMIEDDELIVTEEEELPVTIMPLESNDSDNKAKKVEKPLAVPTESKVDLFIELDELSAEIDKAKK